MARADGNDKSGKDQDSAERRTDPLADRSLLDRHSGNSDPSPDDTEWRRDLHAGGAGYHPLEPDRPLARVDLLLA